MIRTITRTEYVLATLYALISIVLFIFLEDQNAKFILLYGAIIYSLAWPLTHHALRHKLTVSIVLEYLFIACIAILALSVVFN